MINPQIEKCLARVRRTSNQDKIILVTGVFDVLHQEHFNFLKKAKQTGDFLIVGLESDVRVKALKGEHRPINTQDQRLAQLEKLKVVDCVFVLPESIGQTAVQKQLIAQINPDFLATSSNTPHIKQKEQIMKDFKGRVVVVHDHNPKISTTQIIEERGLL